MVISISQFFGLNRNKEHKQFREAVLGTYVLPPEIQAIIFSMSVPISNANYHYSRLSECKLEVFSVRCHNLSYVRDLKKRLTRFIRWTIENTPNIEDQMAQKLKIALDQINLENFQNFAKFMRFYGDYIDDIASILKLLPDDSLQTLSDKAKQLANDKNFQALSDLMLSNCSNEASLGRSEAYAKLGLFSKTLDIIEVFERNSDSQAFKNFLDQLCNRLSDNNFFDEAFEIAHKFKLTNDAIDKIRISQLQTLKESHEFKRALDSAKAIDSKCKKHTHYNETIRATFDNLFEEKKLTKAKKIACKATNKELKLELLSKLCCYQISSGSYIPALMTKATTTFIGIKALPSRTLGVVCNLLPLPPAVT